MQFQSAIISSRNHLKRIVTAVENGKDCWFYIELDKKLEPLFEHEIKTGNIKSLKKYGHVILSGWGKNPPEDIIKKLEV